MSDDAPLFIIKPRGIGDIQSLHMMCLLHGKEMAPDEVDSMKVWERLLFAADNPDEFWMLLAIKGERLVGYLNLYKTTWWFGNKPFIADFGFYVTKSFRSGEVGKALLQAAKDIAVEQKLHLRISLTNYERPRGRMNKEAEIVGFTPIGATLRFGAVTQTTLLH